MAAPRTRHGSRRQPSAPGPGVVVGTGEVLVDGAATVLVRAAPPSAPAKTSAPRAAVTMTVRGVRRATAVTTSPPSNTPYEGQYWSIVGLLSVPTWRRFRKLPHSPRDI
ncbi:hypothetical protein GCM10023148_27140 [Actinokineospora soli]